MTDRNWAGLTYFTVLGGADVAWTMVRQVSRPRPQFVTRMGIKPLFGLLVILQPAHSVGEYPGRLWESFPPARMLTGLISADLRFGFLVISISIVAFGAWCYLLRGATPLARA